MSDQNEKLELDVSIRGSNQGALVEGGIQIQETDLKVSLNDDLLWDECQSFDFNNPPIDSEKLSIGFNISGNLRAKGLRQDDK